MKPTNTTKLVKKVLSEKNSSFSKISLVRESWAPYNPEMTLSEPSSIVKYCRSFWPKDIEVRERVYVILLTRGNQPLGYYELGSGGRYATVMDPAMVAALSLMSLSSSVVVVHNHPSGVNMFSSADITSARNIKSALELFQINLLDSIVITKNNWDSMANNGMI